MKAAELLVRCLENEGVDFIFGLPGEENIDVMDALLDSRMRFITTRHEQGAAFMADVYGRLTGKAGVCLSTLGPGATTSSPGWRMPTWIAHRSSRSRGRGRQRGCTRGTIGLKARDFPWFAFARADVVICVGYDMVEYQPGMWNPAGDKVIVHVDALPAEVDERYIVAVGVLGEIGEALRGIAVRAKPHPGTPLKALRAAILADRARYAEDREFPVKPQKILWDLREVLAPEDIVISDVGAHKMWTARHYRAEQPNTCIISNGFAAMGLAVPGAIAAKLAYPQRKVVAVTGDAASGRRRP